MHYTHVAGYVSARVLNPPGDGVAGRQELCLFNVGCECNGYSVPAQKALSVCLLILECNLWP